MSTCQTPVCIASDTLCFDALCRCNLVRTPISRTRHFIYVSRKSQSHPIDGNFGNMGSKPYRYSGQISACTLFHTLSLLPSDTPSILAIRRLKESCASSEAGFFRSRMHKFLRRHVSKHRAFLRGTEATPSRSLLHSSIYHFRMHLVSSLSPAVLASSSSWFTSVGAGAREICSCLRS